MDRHSFFSMAAAPRRQTRACSAVMVVVLSLVCGFASAQRVPGPGESSAATVRQVQHSLMQGGYAVDAADGVWGPKTIAALKEFQRTRGLQPTGRADEQTLAALGVSATGAVPPAARRTVVDNPPPVRKWIPADLGRATIRSIQKALDQQGLKSGPIDGVWGERTTTAIGNLQRARNMPASGELDAHTLAALGFLPGGARSNDGARPGQPPGPADLDPAAIRLIQQALNNGGYDVGVDGLWGDRTVSALREFQRTRGIEPAGGPDVYTLAELGLLPGSESGAMSRRARR